MSHIGTYFKGFFVAQITKNWSHNHRKYGNQSIFSFHLPMVGIDVVVVVGVVVVVLNVIDVVAVVVVGGVREQLDNSMKSNWMIELWPSSQSLSSSPASNQNVDLWCELGIAEDFRTPFR